MYSLLTHDRICQHCGKEFVSQKKSTKYCSHRCANLADKARKKAQKQLLKQENAKEARRQDLLQKNFLSITEAAKLLQISRNTIYTIIEKEVNILYWWQKLLILIGIIFSLLFIVKLCLLIKGI